MRSPAKGVVQTLLPILGSGDAKNRSPEGCKHQAASRRGTITRPSTGGKPCAARFSVGFRASGFGVFGLRVEESLGFRASASGFRGSGISGLGL